MTSTVGVELPAGLCRLAGVGRTVSLRLPGPVTQWTILDALEAQYPMLRGTLRDHGARRRRPFIRFFGCQQDLSHLAPDDPLPAAIAAGTETLLIIGAIAGG